MRHLIGAGTVPIFSVLFLFFNCAVSVFASSLPRTSSPSEFTIVPGFDYRWTGDYCNGTNSAAAANGGWLATVLTVANTSTLNWTLLAYGPSVSCSIQSDCNTTHYFSQGIPLPNLVLDPNYVILGSHPYLLTQCLSHVCTTSRFVFDNGTTVVYNISVNQPMNAVTALPTTRYGATAVVIGDESFLECESAAPNASAYVSHWTLLDATQTALLPQVTCSYVPRCSGSQYLDVSTFNLSASNLHSNAIGTTGGTPVELTCSNRDPWECMANTTWQHRVNQTWSGAGSIMTACLIGQCVVIVPSVSGEWAWNPETQFAYNNTCTAGLYPRPVISHYSALINLNTTRWGLPFGGNPCQQLYAGASTDVNFLDEVAATPFYTECNSSLWFNTSDTNWYLLPPTATLQSPVNCTIFITCDQANANFGCRSQINVEFELTPGVNPPGTMAVYLTFWLVFAAVALIVCFVCIGFTFRQIKLKKRRDEEQRRGLITEEEFLTSTDS